MSPAERIEAVRLALDVLDQRRQKRLTKEQVRSLIGSLGLPMECLAKEDAEASE